MAPQKKKKKGSKKLKKEAKLLEKAKDREEPSERLAKSLREPKVKMPPAFDGYSQGLESMIKRDHAPRWNKMVTAMKECKRQNLPEKAETLATELIEDIHRTEKEIIMAQAGPGKRGTPPRWLFTRPEYEAFYTLAMVRFERGCSEQGTLQDFQAARDDFTEALSVLKSMTALKNVGSMSEDHDSSTIEPNILYVRGLCQVNMFQKYKDLSQADGGIQDLRACVAAVRTMGQKPVFMFNLEHLLKTLMQIMARRKVYEGATRPHYTHEESTKIARELCINEFSPERYHCAHCGKLKNSQVTLKLCSKCQNVWYCSRECQMEHWKSGHKQDCRKNQKTFTFLESERQVVDMMHARDGLVFAEEGKQGHLYMTLECNGKPMKDLKGQIRMLVRDSTTGEYFDSLSDYDVVFISRQQAASKLGERTATVEVEVDVEVETNEVEAETGAGYINLC